MVSAPIWYKNPHHQLNLFLILCKSKNTKIYKGMDIVFLENKQIVHSFCN